MVLLQHFLDIFGTTWGEVVATSNTNKLSKSASNNEPWKHVRAISEGRRHIGERKNRMTQLDHIRKHTNKHGSMH